MNDESSSNLDYVSAYDQTTYENDYLADLSEEWLSNPSSASDQGSARTFSTRAFNTSKIDTIPEEQETSTVRIMMSETDALTPEWKRRLDENHATARDLFSPCRLEELFREDGRDYARYVAWMG
jgi:hypothetical protein